MVGCRVSWFPSFPVSTIFPPRDAALLAGAPDSATCEVTCLCASHVPDAAGAEPSKGGTRAIFGTMLIPVHKEHMSPSHRHTRSPSEPFGGRGEARKTMRTRAAKARTSSGPMGLVWA